jgi:hypothetical protein
MVLLSVAAMSGLVGRNAEQDKFMANVLKGAGMVELHAMDHTATPR